VVQKEAEMKSIYIHRWISDTNEDMEVIKGEHGLFLEDVNGPFGGHCTASSGRAAINRYFTTPAASRDSSFKIQ
jgi:hypothetical protein